MNVNDPISYLESRYRIILKRVSGEEYAGPCPFCGGADRFHVWADAGNYFCRTGPGHCGRSGWVDNIDGQREHTKEEIAILRLQSEQRRIVREQECQAKQLTALQWMMRTKDHLVYHENLGDIARSWWHAQGITDASIDEYQLGICFSCPCDTEYHRSSYTIPVYDSTQTQLLNIRHRLVGAQDGNKYRPHIPGLPGKMLFNSRFVKGADQVIVVEGSKKSIVVSQELTPAVGILGKGGFDKKWVQHFSSARTVYVALDPDAQDEAYKVAGLFKGRGRVVTLPVKADDFFVMGGKPQEFREYMRIARKVVD